MRLSCILILRSRQKVPARVCPAEAGEAEFTALAPPYGAIRGIYLIFIYTFVIKNEYNNPIRSKETGKTDD